MATDAKPVLRGVSHQWAFAVSVAAGAALVALASGAREHIATVAFAAALAIMFGVSALYHRVNWQPTARRWMRRLDHAAIYVLIAGTYTAFGLLALDGAWRWTVLGIIWCGALAAIVLKMAWVDAPKWLAAAIGLALGWVGIVAFPRLLENTGWTEIALLAAGGLFYTVGALVYALQRPDPVPAVFGYHEVFHALVVAAAACQYIAVTLTVLA